MESHIVLERRIRQAIARGDEATTFRLVKTLLVDRDCRFGQRMPINGFEAYREPLRHSFTCNECGETEPGGKCNGYWAKGNVCWHEECYKNADQLKAEREAWNAAVR